MKSALIYGRLAAVAGVLVAVSAAQASIVFSNVLINSAPLSSGSSFNAVGNSISFNLPNGLVGDGTGLRAGTINIQYDAKSTDLAMVANELNLNLAAVLSGSGTVLFRELIVELDYMGNEVGGIIGSADHVFTPGSSPFLSETIVFDKQVTYFRAKKSFTLAAVDTQDLDLAGAGIVNQSIEVVPEPGTMVALGVGAAALLRRRRK